MTAAPRYEHDCDRCLFLGQDGDDDVYACNQISQAQDGSAHAMPTIIRRWGNDGPAYDSGIFLLRVLPPGMQARAREHLIGMDR